MGIELPESGAPLFPVVPEKLQTDNKDLYEYLQAQRKELERLSAGLFANTFIVATAINLGVSGTFSISSGGSIIVTSGIVISVTS